MMTTSTFTRCVWLLSVGLMSACGSGGDTPSAINTQETVEADSSSNDDALTGSAQETGGNSVAVEPVESDPVESGTVETDTVETDIVESNTIESDTVATDESVPQDAVNISDEGTTESANPQNDSEQASTDTQQEPTPADTAVSDGEDSIADIQGVNFGSARLLVDLVPNGDSYPAKFHRAGDKLYFSTVDTDPRFASCASHWSNLSEEDKSVSFNLVAVYPESGQVVMNKQFMTLGDFAEDANNACAGFNGSIMQVFEQIWKTTETPTGEQQFVLYFDSPNLGPDQVWTTDGSEANTSLTETGQIEDPLIFEGDKIFFVESDGLSVSNTISGERRRLFDGDPYFSTNIKQIARSPERQATFEIRVGNYRSQIWTYDLDTDEWVKTFTIKPDDFIYQHHETVLVNGQTLLGTGYDTNESNWVLGLSSTFGDVTSFEILTNLVPTISNNDLSGASDSSSGNNNDRLYFSTIDFSAEPRVTSIWRYSDARIQNLFSISDSEIENKTLIPGHDGHIYFTATTNSLQGYRLQLWSYNPQTDHLVKLSGDDWFAFIFDHPAYDEGYTFRYLNTPDGLVFINLTEDSGRELWFTDGTPEGTRQLADINPGAGDSDPLNFYYTEDAIYFSANDGTHGREPWMIPISR